VASRDGGRASMKRAFPLLVVVAVLMVGVPGPATAASPNTYSVAPLVSNVDGAAAHTDLNLVNAWGLAAGPSTPWWVADNETDVSTLYMGDGTPRSLVVAVDGAPTGLVFNPTSGFVVTDGTNSGASLFIFATESGTIRGWSPGVPPTTPPPSTQTFVGADRSGVDASYKGLAFGVSSDGPRLYATDFHNARIDVFDDTFGLVTMPDDAFVDPKLHAGFAPFGITAVGDVLYVAYAKQDADAEEEVEGRGLGFVDAFDTEGNFLERVATRGQLNAPWGIAMAPDGFGPFGGDLLVGNFGDGQINAYEPQSDGTFEHVGRLRQSDGKVLSIDGLWALGFGNDAAAGSSDTLFFTAGPEDESEGLFGSITPTG
jgi:uncharacterized protein (TIGR03118 family)